MSTETNTQVLPEVVMTDELAKAVQSAVTTADIKNLLIAEAEKQSAAKIALDEGQAATERAAADKIVADKAAADALLAAQPVTRVEVIGGQEFTFTATTEEELDRVVLNAYKVAYAVREPETKVAEVIVDANETARRAEAEVLAKTELERRFRLGEISAADYIQQSGAMTAFLEKEGISVASLKETVEANQTQKVVHSWAQASEVFKQSAGGADWPGGEKNQELIGLKIAALGLVDAEDKVAALNQAYAEMKRTGLYFSQGDATGIVASNDSTDAAIATKAAADAVVAEKAAADATALALRTAAAARVQSMSSSVFGASSGTSGAPITSPALTAAKAIVPADATPQEILAAYHAEQIKNGIDPNAAFMKTFSSNAR